MNLLKRAFAFKSAPTTIFVVFIYAVVFAGVLMTDGVQSIPDDTLGLDLEQGYRDLHQITARPHPFNSHENDRVRAYIFSRLRNITSGHSFAHVVEDTVSNASWTAVAPHGVYFEGNNVLVKIDGTSTDATAGGVLFSAHLDSVSTAPGTTDDGIGIATMMQFVRYLIKNRPRRTAIFNFNNGEEDGLNGAHVFLEHPWAKIPHRFLNLEGAGAGGRPTLFRVTSTAPLLSFKRVRHPHGNVASLDAFSRGAVRSGTDFSVYAKSLGDGKPVEGLDFAFFQGRSKYHTKHDSIPGAGGVKESLWSMMESVRGAGLALLNEDEGYDGREEGAAPVYFDLFGSYFVVGTQSQLFRLNVSLLVLGQLIVFFVHGFPIEQNSNRKISTRDSRRDIAWAIQFWGVLVFTGLLQGVLVLIIMKVNPYIVYSQPYTFVISSLSLAFLSTTLFPRLTTSSKSLHPEEQRQAMLVQTYYFTRILLLASTFVLSKWQIGVVYTVSGWNVCALLGMVLGFFGQTTGGSPHSKASGTPSEHGALMSPPKTPEQGGGVALGRVEGSGWWVVQLLLVVPVPVTLFLHLLVLLVASLSQTLSDGNNPVLVYSATSLLSVLLVIPSLPFSIKFHRSFTMLVVVTFMITTIYTWTVFPFSQDAPLKMFFQQELVVDLSQSSNHAVRAVTKLIGIPGYLEQKIVPQLPSSWDANVQCMPESSRPGLTACRWETDLLPYPGGVNTTSSTPWLLVNTQRLTPSSALISVQGTNTRTCKMYFDSTNITSYDVYKVNKDGTVSPSDARMQHGYEVPKGGLDSIWLWSRTWGRNFTVEVGWEGYGQGQAGDFVGRVGCEWAEYESGMVGVGVGGDVAQGGKIPAFEEVLSFLPRWATVSKTADGLVEAWGGFVV